MDAATQEALIEQFRAYLETQMQNDPPEVPDTESADAATPDLFTLLAELAALKNEVKLESRQVKTALDSFRELFDDVRTSHAQTLSEQERRREQTQAAERAAMREQLLEWLDLRDRLQAGHDQSARFRPRWWARQGRAPRLIGSLVEGMSMNLRRCDEILARRGVRPLPTLGHMFDPQCMHAVELVCDPHRPQGEVVAEQRSGWLLDDDLLRPAEVVVNRIDSPHSFETRDILS